MLKYALLLTLLFYFDLKGSPVSDILEDIPSEERADLKYLFQQIFLHNDGAYTIFGDKPVSCAPGFLIPAWKATLEGYPANFAKSWVTWQKHKHKFSMKKYAIVSEKYPSKKADSVALYIYVINKKKFIEAISNNISLFEAILHKKIDPEKFLNDITTEKKPFLTSIHHNEMLFGLLLGSVPKRIVV